MISFDDFMELRLGIFLLLLFFSFFALDTFIDDSRNSLSSCMAQLEPGEMG